MEFLVAFNGKYCVLQLKKKEKEKKEENNSKKCITKSIIVLRNSTQTQGR